MQQHLVVTVLGSFKPDLLHHFTQACEQFQCQLVNADSSVLGQELACMFYISGHWGQLAKLENHLNQLKHHHQLSLDFKRTDPKALIAPAIPYLVHISAVDRNEVPALVTGFFTGQKLIISEFSCTRYITSQTQTNMLAISMTVLVPTDTHLAELRESFILFCDEQNLDAMFELDRS